MVRGVSAWGYFCALFVWWLKVGITLCWGHLWWRAPLANRCGSTALACWCFTIVFLCSRLRLPSERPTASVVTSSGSAFLGPAQNLDTYMSWGYFFVWSIFLHICKGNSCPAKDRSCCPCCRWWGCPWDHCKVSGLQFVAWVTVHGVACQLADMLTQTLRFGSVVTPKPPQATQLGMNFCSWGYFLLLGLLVLSFQLGLLVGK